MDEENENETSHNNRKLDVTKLDKTYKYHTSKTSQL